MAQVEIESIKEFISSARENGASNEEILEKADIVRENMERLSPRMRKRWGGSKEDASMSDQDYRKLSKERGEWSRLQRELDELLAKNKNFNKVTCFANIRILLSNNPGVKIGQIEKAAGIRLGYMSRLEKEGNTSEPSMEFITTAAKMLKVSIDTLVSIDLAALTPTEKYLTEFFDKLKLDTLADKLDWNKESADSLNVADEDDTSLDDNPMFSKRSFYEESEIDYPNYVTRIVFNSKNFGPCTHIAGDCFNLRLNNGATLYLMDIEKSVRSLNDPSSVAKEMWIYVPDKGASVLATSQDENMVAPMVESLFSVVKERMEHPKIDKDVMDAIDSFMLDYLD